MDPTTYICVISEYELLQVAALSDYARGHKFMRSYLGKSWLTYYDEKRIIKDGIFVASSVVLLSHFVIRSPLYNGSKKWSALK